MCGLVGVAGKIGNDEKKIFAQLLIADQLRGDHSTGIARVMNYNDEVEVVKMVGSPENLFALKKYDQVMNATPKVLIGHNRWATKGSINIRNAHPFAFDNVVGAHNGTLTSYHRLPRHAEFTVDSECLFNAINELGIQEAISLVSGAYALTWYDKETSTLNFLRNNQRTLFIAVFNKGESIAWASEELMLEWILDRNAVTVEEVYSLMADTHLVVDLKGAHRGKLNHTATQLKGGTALASTSAVVPFRGHTTSQQTGTQKTETTGAAASSPVLSQGAVLPRMEKVKQKDITFRVGLQGTNAHGAPYFNCTTEGDVCEYRLYVQQNQKWLENVRTGANIVADVNGCEIIGHRYVVYRLLASTVKVVDPTVVTLEADDDGVILSKTVVEDEIESTYPDPNGKYMAKAAWMKRFSHCAYCQADVDPDASWCFHKDEILCDHCAHDPVVKDYLCQSA